ncbi:MAG: DUF87 domain-containing protein [Phycisphaerae bacterium]|nr:DUF87 domain-containing protein [Phycisphaerae bacterium]
MNIEKIASKLYPLMPYRINHWLKTRQLADPELKSLIDKQIISTAYKTFGEFHNKILLSLPPEEISSGTINLGNIIYDKEQYPIGISEKELLQNMGIFGRSGSGKTNLAFHIIQQLDKKKIPYLFFDNKRTLRHLIPILRNKVNIYTPGRSLSKFSFNPFITPPSLEPAVYVNQLIDVLANSFTLGDGSKSILQKALFACYNQGNDAPLIKDIIAEIDKIESKERIRGWKISAIRAIETLGFANISNNKTSQKELAQKLINENTVIELDSLSDSIRKFLVPIIYQWLFQVKLQSAVREKLSLTVFIDEAHIIFGQQQNHSESLMERLLRQTRELGIATIIMDQTPSLMSRVVLANCYTNIFLNLVSSTDLSKAATVCLLDPEEKVYFSKLPIGQGIVKLQDRWTKPVLVKFPLMNIQKGFMTDELLKRYFSEIPLNLTDLPWKRSVLSEFDVFRRIYFDVALEKPALQLLFDVISHPYDGIRIRYKRLGINEKIGNRVKEHLLFDGWFESQIIPCGKGRKLLLRLTKQAKEKLNLYTTNPTFGSLEHEYWKNFYAEKFKDNDYQVTLEYPRASGNTDMVVSKNDKTMAIEFETGKSDYMQNLYQNLAAKYDKILIVATNKEAFSKIEKQLAISGLLMPERIILVLQDEFKLDI